MGKRWADALRFVGIGWYVAVCILLGILGGRWLGQKLAFGGSEVIFTILGLCLGLLLAFFGIYRLLGAIITDRRDDDSGDK